MQSPKSLCPSITKSYQNQTTPEPPHWNSQTKTLTGGKHIVVNSSRSRTRLSLFSRGIWEIHAEYTCFLRLQLLAKNRLYPTMQREKSERSIRGANETPQIVMDKVNAMIRDGCKLTDVKVTAAERKTSAGRKPGVIVASIETFPQKQKLMKSKSSLKRTAAYKRVYIENDYCSETRKTDSSLRTILKEIGKNKQYRVEGGKLFPLKGNSADDSGTGGATD